MGADPGRRHPSVMKLTDALLGEHGLFYVMFEHLEQAAQRATSTEQLAAAFGPIAAAILAHAQTEEEQLFPALEAVGLREGPLSVMRAEHAEIDRLVLGIPGSKTLDDAKDGVRSLLALLREHFGKEENVLFPMSEKLLAEAQLCEMGERWSGERGVVIDGGGGCHG